MPEVGAVLADEDDGVVASEVSKTGIEQEVLLIAVVLPDLVGPMAMRLPR
jgi:hypothetical protein